MLLMANSNYLWFIDQSKDTQFVKINKSFIGDGNNVDYASINDGLLFSNVSARVGQYALVFLSIQGI